MVESCLDITTKCKYSTIAIVLHWSKWVPSTELLLVPTTVTHRGIYHTFSHHMSFLIYLLSTTCVFSVLCIGLPLPVCESTGCGGHDCGGDWEALPGL